MTYFCGLSPTASCTQCRHSNLTNYEVTLLYDTLFAVGTGIEPVSLDRQSSIVAIRPTDRVCEG